MESEKKKESKEKERGGMNGISIIPYEEGHINYIQNLMGKSLSEAQQYNICAYRYFLDSIPESSYLALDKQNNTLCGAIVGMFEQDTSTGMLIGYIGMIAVEKDYQNRGIGKALIERFIQNSIDNNAHKVTLETESDNMKALMLYDRLGFFKETHYLNYYYNGKDAYALTLMLTEKSESPSTSWKNASYFKSLDSAKAVTPSETTRY